MKFTQISTCCCCIDLRTGGLIIGYLTLFGAVFNAGGGGILIISVVNSVVCLYMIYGIHKNCANWMVPAIVVNTFALLVLLLSVIIIIPLCNFVFLEETTKYINDLPLGQFKIQFNELRNWTNMRWLEDLEKMNDWGRFDSSRKINIVMIEKLEASELKIILSITWVLLDIYTVFHGYCLAVIISLYKFIQNENDRQRQANSRFNIPCEKA